MAKKQHIITRREPTLADTILFAEASVRLEEILRLIDEYNEIAMCLRHLGYIDQLPDLSGRGEDWPLPALDLCGNGCMTVQDAEFLDRFWEIGPRGEMMQPKRIPMAAERIRLGAESGWKCFYCNKNGSEIDGPDGRPWHVDHAYPLSRGGDDEKDNHVLACATCNLAKKTKTAMEYFRHKRTSEAPDNGEGLKLIMRGEVERDVLAKAQKQLVESS
jgi:hypothetical protein